MKTSTSLVASALLASCLPGCGIVAAGRDAYQAELRQNTALSVGRNVAPDQVTISELRSGSGSSASQVLWHAATPAGEFDCSGLPSEIGVSKTVCTTK